MVQPPDLRQVTVLTKADWLRIQDELNRVNRDKESMREAANQREALHLQSTEVVKLWSNTIAVSCLYLICFLKFRCACKVKQHTVCLHSSKGQRQKKLEAKKIREQIEEEKRKLTDKEEAKYQEQKRKEAIEKAKSQLYYQTDRVKGLHVSIA